MGHLDNMTSRSDTNRAMRRGKSHRIRSHSSLRHAWNEKLKKMSEVILMQSSLHAVEDQTQALLAELIRQALLRIHSGEAGVDSALYRAIYTLQEQNIIENIASTMQ